MKASAADIAEFEKLALERGGSSRGCNLDAFAPNPQAPTKVPTHTPGRMNKTEAGYAAHLELLKANREIVGYWFESVKLRLADKTWYCPDFLVLLPSGDMEMHEVKGFWRDDARVKIKVAQEMYPLFRFRVVRKAAKGRWTVENV